MKRIICLAYFIVNTITAHSQNNQYQCSSDSPSQEWEEVFQQLQQDYLTQQNQTQRNNYTIPVIFHIVHGGETLGTFPNLNAGQIESQITILNQDFSGNAYNKSDYPANAFVNWAMSQNIPSADLDSNGRVKIADLNIQFCLALKDSSGNILAEPGIERINYMDKGWSNPNLFTTQVSMKAYLDSIIKPQSIWDVKKYMNVWVTDKSNQLTYGGVASVPPLSGLPDIIAGATEQTDGIWCYAGLVGAFQLFPSGNYISQFIDGRTLTHEVGHYLGLRHIWGDNACGNDFCSDTPPAGAQNTGSPTYPNNPGSCTSPSNSPDGEMFMNFMDYTMGPSKYMFTSDQKIRAQTAMLNSPFRNQLGTHNLCSALTTINKSANTHTFNITPNPANDKIYLRFNESNQHSIKLYNTSGKMLIAHQIDGVFLTIDIRNLPAGLYFLTIHSNNESIISKLIMKQ